MAIIEGRGGRSVLYRVGDTVVSDLRLRKVLRDSVVLEHDGRFETLAFPREGPELSGRAARLAALRARAAAAESPAADASLSRATQSTLRAFGLDVLHDSAGAVSGISGVGAPMWHAAGLLPSDVIIAIDGQPVDKVLSEPYAIDRAAMAAVTTLTILRDGNQMDLQAEPQPPPSPPRRRRT